MENHLADYEKVYILVNKKLKLSYFVLIVLLYETEMKKSCLQDERFKNFK